MSNEEQTVARNFTNQLLLYSTGAPIGFSDRQQVNQILEKSKASGYGVRNIIHSIVQSNLFQNK